MARTRRNGKKRHRRSRNGKRVSKAVKRYVKKAIKGSEETKVVLALNEYTRLGGLTTYVWTPSWQIAQGDGSNQRIGRQISNASCVINLTYVHNGEGSGPAFTNRAEESVIRCLVLRSRAIKTAGVTSTALQINPASMAIGNIFRWSVGQNYLTSSVETRTWTVLKDFRLKSHRILDSLGDYTTVQSYRKFRFRIGKKLRFLDGDNFGYFVGAETYLVFVCGFVGTANGIDVSALASDNVGTIQVSGEIMFKDA